MSAKEMFEKLGYKYYEYDCPISYEEFFAMVERKQTEENEDDFKYNGNIDGYRFSFKDFS